MSERSRTWSKQGVTVTARIMDDGKHVVEIAGAVTMPLSFPGDAYDLQGNPVALPDYRGRMAVKDMMDDAYGWISRNAPQPPIPRHLRAIDMSKR